MPDSVSPEVVDRMIALVRDLHADHLKYDMHDREQDFVARTAAIVAELPKPVDPDVALAVEMAETVACDFVTPSPDARLQRLKQHIFSAIKKGRELERESRS